MVSTVPSSCNDPYRVNRLCQLRVYLLSVSLPVPEGVESLESESWDPCRSGSDKGREGGVVGDRVS